jgi:hypothetical protein
MSQFGRLDESVMYNKRICSLISPTWVGEKLGVLYLTLIGIVKMCGFLLRMHLIVSGMKCQRDQDAQISSLKFQKISYEVQ